MTLDIPNEKVLSIGSGEGAITDAFTETAIIGKQEVGGGVTDRLTIDRASQTLSLVIHHSKAGPDSDAAIDDEFKGTCSPTSRAF
ncbi:hypothetical protein [Methylobacterium nigriterrae]|uniref:hypothetical protein n=1 Tax=Methylobacterium nigriterrae TaxID=3127512 RepID=UPI003013FFDD